MTTLFQERVEALVGEVDQIPEYRTVLDEHEAKYRQRVMEAQSDWDGAVRAMHLAGFMLGWFENDTEAENLIHRALRAASRVFGPCDFDSYEWNVGSFYSDGHDEELQQVLDTMKTPHDLLVAVKAFKFKVYGLEQQLKLKTMDLDNAKAALAKYEKRGQPVEEDEPKQ